MVPTDEGPGRGAANATECDSSCREKSFSVEEARGGAGRGERRWRGGGHTREPQLAVAATCRRVPREPRDPACPLFFPPLVSSLTALLRLLCRTEIVIYVRTTFPSFSSENRTDLSLRFFVFFLFLSKRASNGIFRNFRSLDPGGL